MAPSATQDAPDPLIGRALGDFVIHERMAGGSFGAVYRAEQRALGRAVAIKILHLRHQGRTALVQRFIREARLASRLDHPYAAHIYAFGAEPDGVMWIAMEWVRGTTLYDLLKSDGPLPLERCVPLFERICEVVHAAHEIGVVHRDLKPANVMIMSRGGLMLPKLLDFGVAKDLALEVSLDSIDDGPAASASSAAHDLQLTQEGTTVGSPPFMAPEQWRNRDVGPRADAYSLGVMAYCMLTGRYPFEASTAAEMAAAHVHAAVPSLGPSFSPALDAVIARALAKKPAHRHASVMDLSVALRTAAGTDEATLDLPALDAAVRDALLSDAPQPIAEAVALLDAARSLEQARAATAQIGNVLARYLAVLALASRVKVGAGPGSDDGAARELLQRLRQSGLRPAEWAELARALVRPFARQPAAHPLPELVRLFFDEAGAPSDPFGAIFELVPGAEAATDDGVTGSVAALSALLRHISFVSDYPLVVSHAGATERWMGLRRASRARITVRGPALTSEHAALLDKDGALLLPLWPLAQIAPPVPRAEREVFLLDGRSRHGARLVALPSGFQHHDDGLWGWLAERGLASDSTAESAATEARAPYLGLSTFSSSDAAVFFGRERESEIALNRLAAQPFLAVVGPSGAGKSSFVSAGVIASIGEGARAISVRPGPSPLAALETRLVREGAEGLGMASMLREDPEALSRCLRAFAATHRRQVFLVVDQFEELFTLGADLGERRAYVDALCRAAREVTAPMRVVITLRDDFLMHAQGLPALREPLAAGLQLLSTPSPEDLVRILVEPARRNGFSFEDPELPREMVAAVASEPGALTLLSFTALRLWEQRDRQWKQLTRRAYAALGGVGGALARHAEELLSSMREPEQRLVREAFRHLVTAEGTRAVLSRGELLDLLGRDVLAEGVLEKLIGARLAVAQEGEGGQERIEIVHETLTQAWPRLVRWQREDAEGARLRDQLRAAARQWEDRGRDEGMLWRGDALTELTLWRSRHGHALTTAERAFAEASGQLADRARRTRRRLVGAAFVALAAGAFLLFQANRRSERAALESRGRLGEFFEEQGRQRALDADPLRALVYLAEARHLDQDDFDLRFLIGQATLDLTSEQRVLRGHKGPVFDVALRGDHVLTIGTDDTARLWSARAGTALQTYAHPHLVTADLSADGEHVVTVGDGDARVWRVGGSDPAFVVADLERGLSANQRPLLARFSPDGRLLATAGVDKTVTLRQTHDGSIVGVLRGAAAAIRSLAFSADGRRIASGNADGHADLWELSTRRLVADAALPDTGPLRYVALAPDGALLLGCGEGTGIDVWDVAARRVRLRLHTKVRGIGGEFSADGRWLAALGEIEQRAQLWSVEGQPGDTLLAHGNLGSLAFSPDSTRFLAASADGAAWIWNVGDGTRLHTLSGHAGGVWSARWSADGATIVTAGDDGTARTWSASPPSLLRTLRTRTDVYDVVPQTGSGTIASTGADHVLRSWDAATGAQLSAFDVGGPADTLALLSDDAMSALVLRDRVVSVIDLAGKSRGAPFEHGTKASWASLSADGGHLGVAGVDGSLTVWDTRTRTHSTVPAHIGELVYLAFSPDGRRVATAGSDAIARLWDVATGTSLLTLRGHTERIETIVFSPDGALVATAGIDRNIMLWDAHDGRVAGVLSGENGQVMMLHFSPDGRLLVSATTTGLRLWSVATGRLLAAWEGSVYSGRVSADGTRLYAAHQDGSVTIRQLPHDTWPTTELDRLLRCRVPFKRAGNQVLPAETDPTACVDPPITR